jgi:hypothetical protein
MQSHGFEAVSATTDLAGIERITGGRLTRSGKGQ